MENECQLNSMLTNLSITLEEIQLKLKTKKMKIIIVDKLNKKMQKSSVYIYPLDKSKPINYYLINHITPDNRYTIELQKMNKFGI